MRFVANDLQAQAEWKHELKTGRLTAEQLYVRIGQSATDIGMGALLPSDYRILNGETRAVEQKIPSRTGSPFACAMLHETVGSENCTYCLERMQGSIIAGA